MVCLEMTEILNLSRKAFFICIFLLAAVLLVACDRPDPQPADSADAELQSSEQLAPDVDITIEPESRIVLVTGATGTQGGAVARELLHRGYHVRGLTRDPQSEQSLALEAEGALMVRGDYDDPISMADAMKDADAVFAVTLFWHGGYDAEVQHGKMLIDMAETSGIEHFVLTSVAGADDSTGIPHFESKWEVEQYLHQSDLNWTVIRPVEFMDNWGWSLENFRQGRLVDPRNPESAHQWIAARDIGYFVAEALDGPGQWLGVTKEIAGDQLTLSELQGVLAGAFDRDFEHVQPSWDEFESEMGEEITEMYRWFENEGYAVDIDELRESHPNLQTASEFLFDLAGSSTD